MGVYVRGDNLGNSGFQMFVDIEIRKYKSKSMFNQNLFSCTSSNVYDSKVGPKKQDVWPKKEIIAFCDYNELQFIKNLTEFL